MLRAYLFGTPKFTLHDKPLSAISNSECLCNLLCYLLLNADERHPRTKLVGVFWPDVAEKVARQNLSAHLWRLRDTLGDEFDEYIASDKHAVWLKSRITFGSMLRSLNIPAQILILVLICRLRHLTNTASNWGYTALIYLTA